MKKILLSLLAFLPTIASAAVDRMDYNVWTTDERRPITQAPEITEGQNVRPLRYFNGAVVSFTEDQAEFARHAGFKVEPTRIYRIQGHQVGPSLPRPGISGVPWGITAIQSLEAHAYRNGSGEGVVVCIVDTGIDASHPALVGRVIGGQALVKTSVAGKDDWFDDVGHGTHVSGTIAANSAGLIGVAPAAQLYAIKVLDSDGSGSDADVADGIKACIGHGQVINMSLGGGPEHSQILQDALDAATKSGIQVACAAGNESGPVDSPADQPGCTAVSAVDVNKKLADFSSFGKEVQFAAPGVGVLSSIPGGLFATWDGTSMATPHVAGTMAIEISRNQRALKATKLPKLKKTEQGKGQINAKKTAHHLF